MPEDMTDIGMVMAITLNKKDTTLYQRMIKTLPESISIDEVHRRIFRQGLITWAEKDVQQGAFNQ